MMDKLGLRSMRLLLEVMLESLILLRLAVSSISTSSKLELIRLLSSQIPLKESSIKVHKNGPISQTGAWKVRLLGNSTLKMAQPMQVATMVLTTA